MFASLGGSLKKWSSTGTPTYCWDWIQLIHPIGPLGQRRWHQRHQNQNVPLNIPSDGLSFTPAFLFHPLSGSTFTRDFQEEFGSRVCLYLMKTLEMSLHVTSGAKSRVLPAFSFSWAEVCPGSEPTLWSLFILL